MNVLVVGGAGYIGSVTVERLLAAGLYPIVFDNLNKGHRASVPAQVPFFQGDMSDRAALDAVFTAYRIDAVMHFAALSLVGESVEHPARYFGNNVAGGLVLLDAMRAAGVTKLVFSSTAAVYGEPERWPIEEDFPHQPTNPYGESKLAFEKALKWYERAYGLRYAALRYFNACGATERVGEDHDPETHLIPLILQVAQGRREHIGIFGDDYPTADGTCVRDYIHVVDLAEAHIQALGVLEQRSVTYNLGNGTGFSVKQVIEAARKVTGHPIPARVQPRRAGDPAVLVASSARIREELGWVPQRPDIETIIADAWAWHEAHPQGYAPLQQETSRV
ncbi:MAG: UDP-glucose 4-epimerase GalE [Candidatus Sericytochromatia bacterium]|nr:UDP-glucose 4-epimerase GalE [Candidatus Sericytochromatia bacterium]